MTESVDLILDAARVVVGDGSDLVEASIAVRDGIIAGVGGTREVHARFEAETVHDYSHHLVMPGLVNAHTHLAMTLLRGYAEGVDLQGFLERVLAAEATLMDPETVALGTELGAVESLLAGATTALDMYFHAVAAHEAAARVGLRHVGGQLFFDVSATDGLPWEERIETARRWPAELGRIGGPYVPAALMPHGTYTVSPEHLAEVETVAEEIGALVHVHASENEAENAEVLERYGKTPIAILDECGILGHPSVIGHGVHLTDTDVALLSARRAAVVHCPVSELKLASGLAHMARLRAGGVTVSLGTDGCSSSNDLDPWVMMRTAALVATTVAGSPVSLPARDIVAAATSEGAKALGMGDRIGTVHTGLEADLIVLDLDQPHMTPTYDVHALLVFAAGRADVVDVFVAGRQVVKDRSVLTVDTADLLARVRARVGGPVASSQPRSPRS